LLILSIILGFFAFPYNASILAIVGCVVSVALLGWIAKRVPNIYLLQRTLKVSWRLLVPIGVSVPAVFFFLFNSALISLAIGTMIVGGLIVVGYEQLLTRWAKIGFNNTQKLGLITGAIGFWAFFFDSILELIGRLGTSILGISFVAYLVYLRRKIAGGIVVLPSVDTLAAGLPKVEEPVRGSS